MTAMTPVPNAPEMQRLPETPRPVPPVEHAPVTPPSAWQPPTPPPPAWQPPTPPLYGLQTPALPAWQQATPQYEPTAGMRLALAITSLVLLIPLSAIAIGSAVPLASISSAWVGILIGLLAFLLVCAMVIGVNVLFNIDQLRRVRR